MPERKPSATRISPSLRRPRLSCWRSSACWSWPLVRNPSSTSSFPSGRHTAGAGAAGSGSCLVADWSSTPCCSVRARASEKAEMGFEERGRLPMGDEAVNVFMGLPGDDDRLELTYNFGVDSYELGTGYGHVAVTVDDLDATLERLAGQGIEPERPPYSVREGGSRLCLVRDPDS